jgi:hypothetical protein
MIRKNFQNQFARFNFNDMLKYKNEMNGTNGTTHTVIFLR